MNTKNQTKRKSNTKQESNTKPKSDTKQKRDTSQKGNKNRKTDEHYKDRMFRLIFREKSELLSLYNAVNGTHYDNPDDLEVNTLENAIYMAMRNDLSFLIDDRMSLYEHQSTKNPNIPLRNLQYIADLYSALTVNENLYGSKLVKIPTPRFVVFYNGVEEHPERQVLKLSNAYLVQEKEVELELKVAVININPGYNTELMKGCKTLRDYTLYVDKVRQYARTMSIEDAVERAIRECIEDNVLADFLRRNRAEARKVSIYEYDEEKHMKQVHDEGLLEGQRLGEARGLEEGQRLGKARGLEEGQRLGEAIGQRQAKIQDIDTLIQKMNLDLTAACQLLDVSEEEYRKNKNQENVNI